MYFIKARNGRNEWWRYLAGLSMTLLGYMFIGAIPFTIALAIKTEQGVPIDAGAFSETLDPGMLGFDKNTGLVLMLFPSVLAFFILWGVMAWLHGKKTGDIASAEGRIRWKRIVTGALLWLVLTGTAEFIFYTLNPDDYTFSFIPEQFFPLLIIVLLLIPFQAWFEELLFRAYLMQGIGLLFRSRIVALLITATGFGLMHSLNPEVKEFGMMSIMPFYIGFGIFAGLLVVMDNGIELALGVHAINNIYGAVFVTYESSALKTHALFSLEKVNPNMLNLVFIISATIFIIVMARIYSWGSWKKLIQKLPA